jgi:hypothetical protein
LTHSTEIGKSGLVGDPMDHYHDPEMGIIFDNQRVGLVVASIDSLLPAARDEWVPNAHGTVHFVIVLSYPCG